MSGARTIPTRGEPSPRLLRAAGAFGVWVARASGNSDAASAARAAALDRTLRPGQIALVTGPSGCGKSTLLRAFAVVSRSQVRTAIAPRAGLTVIDSVSGPLAAALVALAGVGLGDATLLGRRVAELSEGERSRLALAVALARGSRGRVTILADEFASVLDRPGARLLAAAVRRWVDRHPRVRLVCATAHDDLIPWLRPEIVVRVGDRPAVAA